MRLLFSARDHFVFLSFRVPWSEELGSHGSSDLDLTALSTPPSRLWCSSCVLRGSPSQINFHAWTYNTILFTEGKHIIPELQLPLINSTYIRKHTWNCHVPAAVSVVVRVQSTRVLALCRKIELTDRRQKKKGIQVNCGLGHEPGGPRRAGRVARRWRGVANSFESNVRT